MTVLADIRVYQLSKFTLPLPLPMRVPFGFFVIGQFRLMFVKIFILFFFFFIIFLMILIVSFRIFQFNKPALMLFIKIQFFVFFMFSFLINFNIPLLFFLNLSFLGNFLVPFSLKIAFNNEFNFLRQRYLFLLWILLSSSLSYF